MLKIRIYLTIDVARALWGHFLEKRNLHILIYHIYLTEKKRNQCQRMLNVQSRLMLGSGALIDTLVCFCKSKCNHENINVSASKMYVKCLFVAQQQKSDPMLYYQKIQSLVTISDPIICSYNLYC